MDSTSDSYCHDCEQVTLFKFDGEGWECNACGAYDTQGKQSDSDLYYHD